MTTSSLRSTLALAALMAMGTAQAAEPRQSTPQPAATDPRLRELTYDPQAVVQVPTRRGEVTLIVLAPDEAITDVAAGLGGDCGKPESPWCIATQPGSRHVFIKPKSTANAANNMAIVTTKRLHSLRLEVLPDNSTRPPLYRLTIQPPSAKALERPGGAVARSPDPGTVASSAGLAALAAANTELIARLKTLKSAEQLVADRMQARPSVQNTNYTIAEGADSSDIAPTMVFDDGRFTYLKLPGNREVPAVFHVQGDGSEALLNTRMDQDLLVVDRVARKLVLRAGNAVISLHNEAFDVDGIPPEDGTTVPGLQRVLKTPGVRAGATLTGEAR